MKPRKRKGAPGTHPITSVLRFDPISAEDLSQAQINFGRAARAHQVSRGKLACDARDFLIVLIDLGYSHPALAALMLDLGGRLRKLNLEEGSFPIGDVFAAIRLSGWDLESPS